jgi:crotonobetainyl-CoA:carnitine CoA-transferase CaiB-like acyl-CoA transferase
MASLMLAEAGAQVTKVERPGQGDAMREYEPRLGSDSAAFAMLNRGKSSVTLDLKDPLDVTKARAMAMESDVIIEQFRPGVMERLGLSYEVLAASNPLLVYCSITGYGQDGPKAQAAGHDLNYAAETGFLSLVTDGDGRPVMPASPIADIGGGAYPAVINILLALAERAQSGRGRHLDISMSENLFPFMYWALASGFASAWPEPGRHLVSGGTARYRVYRTKDGQNIAAAPIEARFWSAFCEMVGVDEAADVPAVQAAIGAHDVEYWRARFAATDVCCAVVVPLEEAVKDPQVVARGVFEPTVSCAGRAIPALPLPLVRAYRDPVANRASPSRS